MKEDDVKFELKKIYLLLDDKKDISDETLSKEVSKETLSKEKDPKYGSSFFCAVSKGTH